jgi:ribose-phosphate pyrophosphokinase
MKKFGLAVPKYQDFGINGPYLGDLVWENLREKREDFDYIPVSVVRFADTSGKVVTEKSTRGKDIYIVHPYEIEHDSHVSVTERIADEMKRSGANKIILIEPYNKAYRQDRRFGRESLDTWIVADRYKNVGINRVFTFDPHVDQVALAFSPECPLEVIYLTGFLGKYIKDKLFTRYRKEDFIVVAPDFGAHGRAKALADFLNIPLIIINKKRIGKDIVEPRLMFEEKMSFDLTNKNVLIRDDVYGTGGTVVKNAKLLRDRGVNETYACISHIDMCKGDCKKTEQIKKFTVENNIKIIGTNSIPHNFTDEEKNYFDICDISSLIAEIIDLHSRGESISKFFNDIYNDY